jgi:hypothetical protein
MKTFDRQIDELFDTTPLLIKSNELEWRLEGVSKERDFLLNENIELKKRINILTTLLESLQYSENR